MKTFVLLDLDDTLLRSNWDVLEKVYFKHLAQELAPFCSPERMIPQLIHAVKCMTENCDPTRTLKNVFDEHFYPKLGLDQSKIDPILESFYNERFATFQYITHPIDGTRHFIDQLAEAGHTICIATNPLFPLRATQHRISWAGLDPLADALAVISSYEDFHFTKPNPAFYFEVLLKSGWRGEPVIMAGDSLELDINPIQKLGYRTVYVGGQNHAGATTYQQIIDTLLGMIENESPISNWSKDIFTAALMAQAAVVHSHLLSLQRGNQWNGKEAAFKNHYFSGLTSELKWQHQLAGLVGDVGESHQTLALPELIQHWLVSRQKSIALLNKQEMQLPALNHWFIDQLNWNNTLMHL